MKKQILLLLLLTVFTTCFSQIYVKDNTAIFAKNTVVYSKGNLELNGLNSNFYLRNEAQFVQGTTGLSTNKGVGKLSVYQEGTVNNYSYNYWCSPIGNSSASSGNENFGITMLNRPTSNVASVPAIILPNSNLNGDAPTLSIASHFIYKFLSSINYSQWIAVLNTPTIAAGEGFTMKGTAGSDLTDVGETVTNNPYSPAPIVPSAQRYDFRGKPNDGNITVNIATDKFTLTGNPYPSALHVNAFLLDPANNDCTGIAYYWEQKKDINSHILLQYRGGYGTYSPVSLLSSGIYVRATYDSYNISGVSNSTGANANFYERKYAPIGQGFMVLGKSSFVGVGNLTIKNAHRDYYKESSPLTHFERTTVQQNSAPTQGVNSVSHILLNTIINNDVSREIALAFVAEATDGLDRGIDAKSPTDGSLPNDSYFFLENEKYVIQGINFDIAKRVKLGIKASLATTVKFSLEHVINFNQSQPIYLYDSFDNSYHNLKTSDYEASINSGTYNDRFEITFQDAALVVPTTIKNNFVIVHNNANQALTVSNPNLLNVKSILIYDIAGKLLLDKSNLGAKMIYDFSTSALSEGVYLVKIDTNENQSLTQKIIVKRAN